jgi:hypothetical protein
MKFLPLILFSFLFATLAPSQDVAPTVFAKWKEKVDPSVDRGLQYLSRVQEKDGSYPGSYGNSCGIPALAGMAFLSRGHMATEGPYANSLNKVDPDRQKKINESLPRALSLILRAQAVKKSKRHQGGWRYHPNSRDSDTSCSGWALMALRSAKLNGADVPDKAIADAVKYLYANFSPKNGHFGYSSPHNQKNSLTGMGLLCLELCGEHGKPSTIKAADFILQNFRALEGAQFEFYGNYYNAQAMFQIGGKYWETYADWMYATYLKKQKDDGSWYSKEAGQVYGTAMMSLSFTVPYRQLPIYQRDETVDEE